MTLTPLIWKLAGGRQLQLGVVARIMAIINVTPDSFSDGGMLETQDKALAHGLACVADGADILDIGGESTRPGAAPVTAAEEQDRVLPVVERLARETEAVISVDTYRAETARLALAAGAHIINDVHGLQREPEIAQIAAAAGAGLCLMHTGRDRTVLPDPVADQWAFFRTSLAIAEAAGLATGHIVLDPGFGFAKETVAANLDLMARFDELLSLGFPILAGTSRKRFLGTLTGREAKDRDVATAATSAILRLRGAHIFRVHQVGGNRDALRVADALLVADQRAREDRNHD